MAAASRSLQPPSPPGDEEEEAVVDVPSMVQIDVPHVQQIYHWDCGLACTKMVLRLLNIPFNDFNLIAQDLKFGTSVWTIDLANILAHYKVDHMFYTITLGVDEGYSNKSFYKKNFTSDERRINELFDSPAQLGISLQQGLHVVDTWSSIPPLSISCAKNSGLWTQYNATGPMASRSCDWGYLKGILSGFDIVDPTAVVPSYNCANYKSVLVEPAHSYLDQLFHEKLAKGKFLKPTHSPQCVHSMAAVPKKGDQFCLITDCRQPIGKSFNKYMSNTAQPFTFTFKKVTLDDIRKHLATQNVAVFLIDWSKLDCRWCHRSCLSNLSFSCLSAYQGHYIVVVGYDTKENAIFYKNPSFKNKLCCCSMKTFENARKSYGTDEDAIFVYGVSTASDNLPS